MSFEVIHPKSLEGYIGHKDVIIVDLREREEYMEYHLTGAVNIPYERLLEEKDWLLPYPTIIFYCDRGNISLLAARDLRDWNNRILTVSGGVHQFKEFFNHR
jgi:rhodanese-related sulfurtransferase